MGMTVLDLPSSHARRKPDHEMALLIFSGGGWTATGGITLQPSADAPPVDMGG